MMKVGATIMFFFVAIIIAAVVSEPDNKPLTQARKDRCSKAITSDMYHSTENYADKLAYERVVRENCAGIEINGIALDK